MEMFSFDKKKMCQIQNTFINRIDIVIIYVDDRWW